MKSTATLPYCPVPRVCSRDWAHTTSFERASAKRRLADQVAEVLAVVVTAAGIIGPIVAACTDWDRVIDVVAAIL